jgi:hypothetical protein
VRVADVFLDVRCIANFKGASAEGGGNSGGGGGAAAAGNGNVMNATQAATQAAAGRSQMPRAGPPGRAVDKIDSVVVTDQDRAFFERDVAQDPDTFGVLVASLAPAIYGHDLVKAGLLLALFGGVQKSGEEASQLSVRGESHVLVVGDPGIGKSQMLQATSNVSPRGVFVSGSNSSSAGLTVTVSREKGSADWALEAGALVLADQGTACVDEFDKMDGDHSALMEAMEQQTISVAKAGVVCTLPARASVIAVANPVNGHYGKGAPGRELHFPHLPGFLLFFAGRSFAYTVREHQHGRGTAVSLRPYFHFAGPAR